MAAAGRPPLDFNIQEAQAMLGLGISATDISKHFQISRPTLYKKFADANVSIKRQFSHISDDELDEFVLSIKGTHPNAGEVYLMGHLQSRGLQTQRRRLRNCLQRVDAEGVIQRRSSRIFRREYKVPCPNYLWHIDGDHKLIRWKFVIHSAIDGFSRLILYLHCSNNNEAATVGELFASAVEKFTLPIRLRTDYGGENRAAWAIMYQHRPLETKPVIAGSSVHNQRVERLHRDVNEQCLKSFKMLFSEMEDQLILDTDNPMDIFCLHVIFLPLINKTLSEFLRAHNHHKISTERNRTPLQLFSLNQHLIPLHERNVMDDPHPGVPARNLMNGDCPHVRFPTIACPLSDDDFEEMNNTFDPLEAEDPVTLYKNLVHFVVGKLF